MPCAKCRKRHSCRTPCEKLEAELGTPPDDSRLVYSENVWEKTRDDGEAFYASRMPDKDARLLSLHDALRPLFALNDIQAAAIFVCMQYFEASHVDICKIFKIKKRRLNVIIQRIERVLADVPGSKDVSEPR